MGKSRKKKRRPECWPGRELGGDRVKIEIDGKPEEIAALVVAIQARRNDEVVPRDTKTEDIKEKIRSWIEHDLDTGAYVIGNCRASMTFSERDFQLLTNDIIRQAQ